jgi:hypothetical protein
MFADATSFNQVLPVWDTGRVTDMSYKIAGTNDFNQVLPAWARGRVENMAFMFHYATSFNQVLPAWDTGCVTNTSFMFAGVIRFNQPLPLWDTGSVTNTANIFAGTAFSINRCWLGIFKPPFEFCPIFLRGQRFRSTSAGLEYINPRFHCVFVCPFGGREI